MSTVEVLAVNNDATVIKELPQAIVKEIMWDLNGPGSATIEFPTVSDSAMAVTPGLDEVQIWIDGVLEFWGMTGPLTGDAITLSLGLDGLLNYFNYRFITNASITYTAIDQLSIAAGIVSTMQTGTDKSFNIQTAGFSPSGVPRNRLYKREEHKSAYDILQEFPTLVNGFDFDIVVTGDGHRFWTPYFPKKGSQKDDLAFEWGKNIDSFKYTEDPTKIANLVYATGATSGGVKFEQFFRDAAFATTYGERQAIISAGNEQDVDFLLAKAQQEVQKRRAPVITPEITVIQSPDTLLGQLVTGDVIPVYINHGRVQINGDLYRILKVTWHDTEMMDYQVQPLGVLS